MHWHSREMLGKILDGGKMTDEQINELIHEHLEGENDFYRIPYYIDDKAYIFDLIVELVRGNCGIGYDPYFEHYYVEHSMSLWVTAPDLNRAVALAALKMKGVKI